MRISIHASRELQVLQARLRELPTEVRKQIRQATKQAALPIYLDGVHQYVTTRPEARVLAATARVAVTDRGVRLQAARVGKALSGGLQIKSQWHAVEFGGYPEVVRTVQRTSSKGRRYDVKRHTQRQLRPRKPTGYVIYPAIADAIPRLAALWVQTVARAGHEAHERLGR